MAATSKTKYELLAGMPCEEKGSIVLGVKFTSRLIVTISGGDLRAVTQWGGVVSGKYVEVFTEFTLHPREKRARRDLRPEPRRAIRGRARVRHHGENDQPLAVSTTATLDESLLATGFPFNIREGGDNNLKEYAAFSLGGAHPRDRRGGVLYLAWLASGRLDGYWERARPRRSFARGEQWPHPRRRAHRALEGCEQVGGRGAGEAG